MAELTELQQAVLKRALQHRSALVAYAGMILADVHKAEDVYQEAVSRAVANAEQLKSLESIDAWLRTICRNLATDVYRQARKAPLLFDNDVLDLLEHSWTEQSATDLVESRIEWLRECLSELQPRARKFLDLRYKEDMSAEDIAHAMGIAKDSVYVTLGRIRKLLRDCIARRSSTGGLIHG